jgi:hypothetical protein
MRASAFGLKAWEGTARPMGEVRAQLYTLLKVMAQNGVQPSPLDRQYYEVHGS